jgi:dimethylargininase
VSTRFNRAVLRRPGDNFASGITTSEEGAPDFSVALTQHEAYADVLRSLGLELEILAADPSYPDGVFVEDTAVIIDGIAIVARPGASTRLGETTEVEHALKARFSEPSRITAPGTMDGGDVCETDEVVLIGVSERTNEAGARQLASILADLGRPAELINIRSIPGLLHLKTGLSYLGEGRLALAPSVELPTTLKRFEAVMVDPGERYAANCIRINDKVLIPTGAPHFAERLARLGYATIAVEMGEFRKMDGGLSCLSLRF